MTAKTRPVIYQLFVRLFGNTNPTRKPGGTIQENGCGKFADVNDAALASLQSMGFTHIWLTGVLEQASGTDYPGRPGDHPDLLKGRAGSPYAVRDYFDVCPDLATDPEHRREEFQQLVQRCHTRGLKVIIDYIPNHVARSYSSDVHPQQSFGAGDDPTVFFNRDNHFYYLTPDSSGPPLILPVVDSASDAKYHLEDQHGKVTGNNIISWQPAIHDWYETVKLNYGHDFTTGRDTSHLPGPDAAIPDVPKTWQTMDEILAWWQSLGVDGFRVDMAHMVPMEFWRWLVRRARSRDVEFFFMAEAYDNDPMKLTDGNVFDELLSAGFDAVYDDPCYDIMEGIYDAGFWANDLDQLIFSSSRFHHSLRYAENHDEVRIANPAVWGGHGKEVGKAASAILFGMGRGPVMIYNGQEIGEPCGDREGFSQDPTRTSIFDYWSMREFSKWVNHGKYDGGELSPEQADLRDWYARLLHVIANPAFTNGEFFGLNFYNQANPRLDRIDGETCSGHWVYTFLRNDPATGQIFLVVANLHPTESIPDLHVIIPSDARRFVGREDQIFWKFIDRLPREAGLEIVAQAEQLADPGVPLGNLPAFSALMLEVSSS